MTQEGSPRGLVFSSARVFIFSARSAKHPLIGRKFAIFGMNYQPLQNAMKHIFILLLSFLFSSAGCENIDSYLTQAKPYTVVAEHELTMNDESRTGKIWFITSEAATTEEFAQTAIQAAFDLHKKNKKTDVLDIELIPYAGLEMSGMNYARVSYATDNKGYTGISGTDPNDIKRYTWFVQAADRPLTEKELTLARLWFANMKNFPAKQVYSSSLYEKADLQKFIADTMHIPVSEVELPVIKLREYKSLPFIKSVRP